MEDKSLYLWTLFEYTFSTVITRTDFTGLKIAKNYINKLKQQK